MQLGRAAPSAEETTATGQGLFKSSRNKGTERKSPTCGRSQQPHGHGHTLGRKHTGVSDFASGERTPMRAKVKTFPCATLGPSGAPERRRGRPRLPFRATHFSRGSSGNSAGATRRRLRPKRGALEAEGEAARRRGHLTPLTLADLSFRYKRSCEAGGGGQAVVPRDDFLKIKQRAHICKNERKKQKPRFVLTV